MDIENYAKVQLRLAGIIITASTHTETICLLSKLKSKKPIEVELKVDELDLTAAESSSKV